MVASLMLSLTALAAERTTKTPAGAEKGKVRDRARADMAQSPEAITKQLAALKREQQAAISELEEIKKLANEEKATKTVGALDKLIARRNQEFQKRIEPLQQRLKKLEARAKDGGNNKNADAPKTEGGKSKPKGKNKGTPDGQ